MKMKKQQYAIVDIETTGGNASGSRITEIAIIIHDGKNILERWESLVNPQKDIPVAIFALTGIDNEMVKNAPVFDTISEKVLELLTDRIFVAHNVNFDYSFVRHELEKSGFKWTARKLCTVRAARKIRPGLSSYRLGKLCHSLGIPLENQHRAGGDVDATAILFSKLVEWDSSEIITKMIRNTALDQRLPPNLAPEDFEQLPEKPGVYYFYNQLKKVIYVGKAVNLKKRVGSHFTGHKTTLQRQNFLRDIYSISYEVCATELMALLLECVEIKKLWPVYNTALKRFEPKYGLFEYEARNGYRYLAVGKVAKSQLCIEVFNSEYEAINILRNLMQEFGIDYRFCKFPMHDETGIFAVKSLSELPELMRHNQQVENAIGFIKQKKISFAIIDKGRSHDERSCIWVENGHFYGMGYISSDIGFTDPSEIRDFVIPYPGNHYIMQLILSYAEKYPAKVFFNKTSKQK